MGVAYFCAFSASGTFFSGKMMHSIRYAVSTLGACFHTFATCDAHSFLVGAFLHGAMGFGIVAPGTMQRTPFQKDDSADTGAIGGRESLYVECFSCVIHDVLSSELLLPAFPEKVLQNSRCIHRCAQSDPGILRDYFEPISRFHCLPHLFAPQIRHGSNMF